MSGCFRFSCATRGSIKTLDFFGRDHRGCAPCHRGKTALVKCLVQQQNAVSLSNQRRGDGTISGGAQSSRAADRLASARPEKRRGVLSTATEENRWPRNGSSSRCDPHLASTERERGYTEFPARGDIPSSGRSSLLDADGRSRAQECSGTRRTTPHLGAVRAQVGHRQRASHATSLTGNGTLVKAPWFGLHGRQDQWVSEAMPKANDNPRSRA